MIPVIVGEEDRHIAPSAGSQQSFPEADDAGAGVEDEETIGDLVDDLDTGGVAAVADDAAVAYGTEPRTRRTARA